VLAVFAFRRCLKVESGPRIGFWRVLRTRGVGMICGNLGVMASERCLTISSEERETWTAASLRGLSGCEAGKVRRDKLTVTFQTMSCLGWVVSNVVRRSGRLWPGWDCVWNSSNGAERLRGVERPLRGRRIFLLRESFSQLTGQ